MTHKPWTPSPIFLGDLAPTWGRKHYRVNKAFLSSTQRNSVRTGWLHFSESTMLSKVQVLKTKLSLKRFNTLKLSLLFVFWQSCFLALRKSHCPQLSNTITMETPHTQTFSLPTPQLHFDPILFDIMFKFSTLIMTQNWSSHLLPKANADARTINNVCQKVGN